MNRPLSKLTVAEQRRLDRLRATAEGRIRRALENFLRIVTSDAALRRIIRLLELGDSDSLLRVIEEQIIITSDVLSEVFVEAGVELVDNVVKQQLYQLLSEPVIGITFNPEHPEAVELMRRNRLEFVRGFTDKQREASRAALVEALRTGAGPIDAARAFRDSIGLTEFQLQTVLSYRRLLEEGSRQALERDLRDRRFDRTVARAATNEKPLTQEQIDRMVERYRQRFLIYRSEVIARTETTRILSQARHNAMQQVMVQAGIRDEQVRRTWSTNLDGRERLTHHEMNAQEVVGMNSYFTSPSGARIRFPGDPDAPADEVIQCRCALLFDFSIN